MDVINAVFLAWTGVIPVAFIFLVCAGMFCHFVFFGALIDLYT